MNARLYTLPDEPMPVDRRRWGPEAAKLAGARGRRPRLDRAGRGDSSRPTASAGGSGTDATGMVTVCWAATEAEARATALEWWPNAALRGTSNQELPLPSHFEQAAAMVDEEAIARVDRLRAGSRSPSAGIQEFVDAGFDQVYVHQVGPDQDGFIDFYEREVLGEAQRLDVAA